MSIPRTVVQTRYNDACDRFGTDKACLNHTFAGYNYMDHYAKLLNGSENFRNPNYRLKILEIGVLDGKSLLMWNALFPGAEIVGIDIKTIPPLNNDAITFYRGNQTDLDLLERINNEHGPFDLIVDDGSHSYRDILTTLTYMLPRMQKHGYYVVEDIHVGWPMPSWPGIEAASMHQLYMPNDLNQLWSFMSNLLLHIHCRTGPVQSLHFFHGMLALEIADTNWSPSLA